MLRDRGPEWDSVVVVTQKGLTGRSQDKVKCNYCGSEFFSSATRIRNHIISSTRRPRGAGVGACSGNPPKDYVERLTKLDQKKNEQARENERLAKMKNCLVNPDKPR